MTEDQFINKYEKYIKWYVLSSNKKLTIDFIKKYKDKLNWTNLSKNEIFLKNEEYLDEFKDKLNWTSVCYIIKKDELTYDFVEKYKNYLHWRGILSRFKINKEIFNKYHTIIFAMYDKYDRKILMKKYGYKISSKLTKEIKEEEQAQIIERS